MPKYLFTSDLRISSLSEKIQKTASLIVNGGRISDINDKSENNNATTLAYYFNLYENTLTCNIAASHPINAIRNFILKFQFPNTRTRESYNDSLSENTLFAPYRSVVRVLFRMSEQDEFGVGKITLNEVLYYLFCNKNVYTTPNFDVDKVIDNINKGRRNNQDIEGYIKKIIIWNQYRRQVREMMTVLTQAFACFKISKNTLVFSKNDLNYNDNKEAIDRLLSYHFIWYPSNKDDFYKAEKEYISYMDMKDFAYSVIDYNITQKENGTQTQNSLQQIYYGAPGTGKSKTIKEKTEEAEKDGRVFRTTFHPDSDYSTFVGCYKPTKVKSFKQPRMDMSLDDLAKALGSYYKDEELGKIGGLQQFCLEYYPYIDGEYMSVNVTKLIELAGVPKDYNVEVNKYIKFIHLLPHHDSDKITYEFIPQAFTNAYVKAWDTEEDVYLIIEEINRGNCAQIFGDLFQLLDRKNGVSEYPIDADADLANYLSKKLAGSTHKDITDEIKEGKKLKFPSNLYIWATMNTSDQSLFPIDSAFKRRWDWKYIPIKEHPEKNYKIEIGEKTYDWWGFLERINKVIGETTSSEDKKLGYFFVKTETSKVSDEQFVGKVLFYLWNDVFKNYGYDHTIFSKGDKDKFVFSDFFNADGTPNKDNVQLFLKRVEDAIKIDRPLDVTPKEETTTVSEGATVAEA